MRNKITIIHKMKVNQFHRKIHLLKI